MVFYHRDHLLVIEFCPFMDGIIRPLNHKNGGKNHTQQQQQKQTSTITSKETKKQKTI